MEFLFLGCWSSLLNGDQILALGPMYLVTLDDLSCSRDMGIGAFFDAAAGIHRRLCDFIHQLVVHRRDQAIRGVAELDSGGSLGSSLSLASS